MTGRGTAASDEIAGVMKLYVAVPAHVELNRVPAALGRPDADWLGDRTAEDESTIRRYACDLELRVGPDRRLTFRKSAVVGLGIPALTGGTWAVPIEWRAATLAPLFPVFAGRLRVHEERLELDGHYAPPGGAIGYVLDRAILHVAAQGTGRWFLEKVVAALGGAPLR